MIWHDLFSLLVACKRSHTMSLTHPRQRGQRTVLVLCSLLGLLVLSGLLPGNKRAFATASTHSALAFYNYPVQPPGELRTTFSASMDNEVYMKWTMSGPAGRHYAHFTVIAPDQSI